MSGILNKVKEVVTGQSSNPTTHDSTTGTHTGSTTGDYSSSNTGYGSSNTGTHSSNIANKIDPRTDADRDGKYSSGTAGYAPGSVGSQGGPTPGYAATHNTESGNYGSSTTDGPHNSNVANKLDPRVDSDRDGSNTSGAYGSSTTGTGYGSSTTGTGTGYGSSNTGTGYGSSTTGTGTGYGSSTTGTGPHNSGIANKLDPRVDSDRDGSHSTGTYGSTGSTEYNQGHHGVSSLLSDNVASKVDPQHHSSTLGTGGTHHGNHGMSDRFEDYQTTGSTTSGYGSTTTGPHNSSVANKLDPRVDSDRDGSHNTGAYGSSTTGTGYGSSTTGTGYGSSTTGTGHGSSTTGAGYGSTEYDNYSTGTSGNHAPHKSSLLNKLDPRVDTTATNTTGTGLGSSNTTGNYSGSSGDYAPGTGNQGGAETMFGKSGHGQSGIPSSEGVSTGPYADRDTRDAAQVPPSAFGRDAGHHMSTGGSKSGGAI